MELRKKALVTGASRGIGRGIAWAFAEAGYDLAIGHWNDAENAELTASRIRSEWGRECFVFPGNLAEAGTAAELAEQAWASLGRIDVLVNNAGITRFQGVTDLSLEVTDLLYQTNFRSPLLLMKEVSTRMIAAGIAGCLLNITSSRAERAYPKDPVYGGLKAALKRAVESVAIDLAPHRIRVNGIAPGETLVQEDGSIEQRLAPIIPLGRMGRPADIGNIAVWLASEQASYITGVNLRADGGLILPGTPE